MSTVETKTPGLACMTINCPSFSYSRGVCQHCYNNLRRRVSRGSITWDAAVKDGLCLPATPHAQRRKPPKRYCNQPDCERLHYARGMCERHYNKRFRYAGQGKRSYKPQDDPAEIAERTDQVKAERIASERTLPRPGNTVEDAREWERWFFRRWDHYLDTRIGSTEARTALDAVSVRGKGV